MKHHDLTGQILDVKYQMTRELGRGGMGTVYLATHLGTERPVAVKIIAPQFMQRAEFVERFRREAKAAGRLRHPNVVDVTDFGFAETSVGQVAYLVMEYLDGCTLGEILDEEQNLPVGWTIDILEQVCSAVQEAHDMGIIHRDLKPDNIWLEPNQRGGYTVKVLDFGIAKLEEHESASGEIPEEFLRSSHTQIGGAKTTLGDSGSTISAEASTIVQTIKQGTLAGVAVGDCNTISLEPILNEKKTAIYDQNSDPDTVGTKLISKEIDIDPDTTKGERTTGNSLIDSPTTAGLTRVGAVLGTPLYMSPEQCRGEHLDARSDIYSLGVIAYQMLSGRTPFEGDFKEVMESHKNVEPPPLAAKKVRRKLRKSIHAALAKDPAKRPQTAEGFASVLRSRSEGIWGLLSRALVIYSAHLPKFLTLSAFYSIPIIVLTLGLVALSYLRVSEMIESATGGILIGIDSVMLSIATVFCTNLIIGSIAWVVIQHLTVPLRPLRLRPALAEARQKWKRIAGAGILTTLLPFVTSVILGVAGFIVFGIIGLLGYFIVETFWIFIPVGLVGAIVGAAIGFMGAYLIWILVPSVIMLENVGVVAALRRSMELVRRSIMTTAGAVAIMLVIPAIIAGSISYVVNVSAKAFDSKPNDQSETVKSNDQTGVAPANVETATDALANSDQPTVSQESGFNFGFDRRKRYQGIGQEMDMPTRVRNTVLESLIQLIWLPMQILVFSFSSIIVALLYIKTRLAGGESLNDLVERFEDGNRPTKKWQEQVRQRLIQSGRLTSKP